MPLVLFPSEEIEALRERYASVSGSDFQITVATTVDPIALMRAGARLFHRAQLICQPDGRLVAGLGAAWNASGAGRERFGRLQAKIEAAAIGAETPVFAGFAFNADGPTADEWDGFASAEAVVPQVAVVQTGEGSRLILTRAAGLEFVELVDLLANLDHPGDVLPFDPGDHSVVSHPPISQWRTEVEEAIGAIAQGDLSKVVLSRSVVVTTEQAPSAFDLVDHLRAAYPQCYVFVWQIGDSAFIGASPELLLEKSGGAVRVNPLAGSARRGEGEADDRALGEALMHSAKDREEHQLVVEDIAARLEPHVADLQIPAQPSLRRMATVQHLSTEIVGSANGSLQPLQLVNVMHPTPAVGGTPRAAALAFVDKVEGIDRGWYAGGIGWLTVGGDATFAIPLRCALMSHRTAHLYAGAGIVAESRPEAELDETRLKFRPMLSVLTAT